MPETRIIVAAMEWAPSWALEGKCRAVVSKERETGAVFAEAFAPNGEALAWLRVPDWVKMALHHTLGNAMGIGVTV